MAGFLQSWRTTDNGLEARAVQHSDTFLPMDELGQATAPSAAKTVYMVANGQGKQRAGISGEGRPVAEFRVLFLSTGEVSLAAKLAEDGLTSMAGQETRFVDLEADAGAGIGSVRRYPWCGVSGRIFRRDQGRWRNPLWACEPRVSEETTCRARRRILRSSLPDGRLRYPHLPEGRNWPGGARCQALRHRCGEVARLLCNGVSCHGLKGMQWKRPPGCSASG